MISLRLLPRADGIGRVPAVEVMIVTPYIRDCIENKEKTKYIREQIALGTSQYGMQTFDQSLFQLYKAGLITLDEALQARLQPRRVQAQDPGRAVHRRHLARADGGVARSMRRRGDLLGGDAQFEIERLEADVVADRALAPERRRRLRAAAASSGRRSG